MNPEGDLLRLARERETASEAALGEMLVERPDILGRQFRDYLSRKLDQNRMRLADEGIPSLTTVSNGVSELACAQARFSSGATLMFNIQLQREQRGWRVLRFKFHLHLAPSRGVKMVRIHLNQASWHDPLAVPRCHLHVDSSLAHVPFPIMNPRLILHVLCEHIEPDFGT